MSVQITFWVFHFDLVSVSFAGFSIFVSFGVFIFLEASLRGLHAGEKNKIAESKTGKKNGEKKFEPRSLFYYKRISEENPEQWVNYFNSDDVNDLMSKASSDHIRETYSIAKKARNKVKLYKMGKLSFYLAIVFFIMLALAGCYALG